MIGKGLKLEKSQFPKILQNPLYMGKLLIPAYGKEEEELVEGIHQAIITESLFYKVQGRLNRKIHSGIRYQKENDEAPLRSFLICPKCGRKLTSSISKGRSKSYPYYHCKSQCQERIKLEVAHASLLDYFHEVEVAPEVAELYLEVMRDICKVDQRKISIDVKKATEQLRIAEEQLDNLEMMNISKQIESDSYERMKPKLKKKILECRINIGDFQSSDKEFLNQVEFSVSLLQNLVGTYLASPDDLRPKNYWFIFPENLSIINNECRTARENEVIVALRGFTKATEGGKNRKPSKGWVFRVCTQRRNRTGKSLRTQVFETSASTSSASWAFIPS